ncbi:MAG: ImmA/IrrE family metallo-endopeptidase [Bacteroidota bacterium]
MGARMADMVEGIHPAILRWARETQGYSLEEVAARLQRDVEEVMAWESGEASPTYAQLEKLAYKVYKRPIAIFFLPEAPVETSPKGRFRTLPQFDLETLSSDTLYQIRLAQALLLSLGELNDGVNSAKRKVFRDIKLSVTDDIQTTARQIREYLGVSMQMRLGWGGIEEALKAWRLAIEDVGVYVFKSSFKQKEISGFCLIDAEFPILYINNSTTKTRQIFSLLHELAHVLLGVYGISKYDQGYVDKLGQQEQRIERFCNALAAEVLIPTSDFQQQISKTEQVTEQLVEKLARRYSVSREAILRRMLDIGIVSRTTYEEKAAQWTAQVKENASGGDYYATRATYLGEHYLQLVFGKHYQGKLSLEQVAEYLGVKTGSVPGLEALALRKAVP